MFVEAHSIPDLPSTVNGLIRESRRLWRLCGRRLVLPGIRLAGPAAPPSPAENLDKDPQIDANSDESN
jgi:hypothetical protein